MGNTRRQVAKVATVIMIISVLGKLIGFFREQVIASQFGATGLTDAYVAAYTVPQMLSGLIGGTIGTAFLPAFMSLMAGEDRREGWGLLTVTFRLTLVLLVAVSLLAFVAAPPVVSLLVPNFGAEQKALTVQMLRIMLPGVAFMGLSSLLVSMLNSFKQFAGPALGPLVMNVGIIGLAITLADRWGVVGLAWATLGGSALQFVFLGWQVKRRRVSFSIKARRGHPGLRQVLFLAGPMVVGALFGQLYLFVDKGFASGLEAGSIAALNYALKLTQLPVGIFVMALATAIYPTLAEYAGQNDRAGVAKAVGSGVRLLSLVMVPAAVGLIVLRVPIVRLAFERGSFDGQATLQTATALAHYAIGLLGVSNLPVLARAFYSLQDSVTPVKVGIATALCNILLDVLLVKPLGHGGLALANSLAQLGSMCLLIWLLRQKTRHSLGCAGALGKILAASGVMGLAVYFAHPVLSRFGQIVALGGAVALGLVVYLAVISLLGVEELDQLMAVAKRRLGLRFKEQMKVA